VEGGEKKRRRGEGRGGRGGVGGRGGKRRS